MEKIPGKRKDSYLYIYEGFIYNMDKRYTYIYRCAKRRTAACKGVLVKEDEKFIVQTNHNHPSDPYIFDVLNLKSEMVQMCQETTTPNKEIFDTVSRKNPKAAAYMSYSSMRNILSKEKIKMRPPLPSSACDLGNLLQDYEPVKFIYKGCVISEDNKCSYIFTSDKLLEILEESSEIFIDGTFSVVPRVPNFAQLFSVHVRYMDKGIAVLFVLCEARTQLVYKSIWKEIIKLAPALQCNLRFIMSDYEKASMNAIHEQFPHASVHGCWFHYCQALLKKWKRLGLLKTPRKILSMAMTLALAPPEMFSEGLNLMQIIADKESDNYPNMLLFMKYMRSTWLPISKKISVHGCPIRTNNLVESFHNILSQKMQTIHPNLWMFLDNISKIIKDQEINYDRLVNGLQVSRNRCQFNKYRNVRIREAQSHLSTGMYSLKEFLHIFEEDTQRQQYNMALLIDDNDEEICADVHTEGAVETVTIRPQSTRRRRRRRRYNLDLNEFEVTTLEEESNSFYSENAINNDQDILEVTANVEQISENSHVSMESASMNDSDLNKLTVTTLEDQSTSFCSENAINNDQDILEVIANVEQISENSHVSMESTSMDDSDLITTETIEIGNRDTEENNDDNEEYLFEVPHDDYGYWNNIEEDKQETPFLSIKSMENINTNSSYEEGICIICLLEKSQIAFLPCGHLCCCKNCIQQLLQEKCPACNTDFDKYISIITP